MKSHQRVITTRWWLNLLVGGWNDEENPPTSLYDSLVVDVAARRVWWWLKLLVGGCRSKKKATNES